MILDAEESKRFSSDIWDQAVTCIENTDCLRKVENELQELTVQDDINIETKKSKEGGKENAEMVAQNLVVRRDTGSKT